jgi:hypothetical protein
MDNTPDDRPTNPAVVAYTTPTEARSSRAAWFDISVKASAMLAAERQGYVVVETTEPQINLVRAAVSAGEV